MGDLEFGFEEMQGVKLGYLVIKGKQMFALSQVFTDLLKNIPRTTVHKRMDHLNVKKHHCDLEELRKLKAINSVAFHAAKCTLISREDVEALYFSCKTERVLKSNKRRTRTKAEERIRDEERSQNSRNGFWEKKLWLSFRGVSPTLALRNKAVRPEISSNLPQIYSKSIYQNFQPVAPTACRTFRNYETVQIPGKCVELNEKRSFFRSTGVIKRKPAVSAISAPSDSELLYKRKRRSERHFGNRTRHYRQVLLVPKCCKPKACLANGSLSHFHADRELYLESRHFQESCSSDTECSSANDSDFGSSLSTSSSTSSSTNSGTTDDDDDEEEDSLSGSSEESSDAETSSQSDSSSVSSRVSVQSIRFRRARFTSLNAKAPLVLQPTFHYRSNFQPKNGAVHGSAAALDCDKGRKKPTLDITDWKHKRRECDGWDCGKNVCCFSGLKRVVAPPMVDFSNEPKTTELISGRNNNNNNNNNNNDKYISFASCPDRKVFLQQRASGYQATLPHCNQDKDTGISTAHESEFSEGANSKKDAKTVSCLKQPSPLKTVKTETEEFTAITNSDTTAEETKLHHVKIKVEDTFDEYEYAGQEHAHQCKDKHDEDDADGLYSISADTAETDRGKDGRQTFPPPSKQEPSSTLNTQGDYKNGARVRKSYRTPVCGKRAENGVKTNAKVDRSPRPAGKCLSKRTGQHVASSLKTTFNFMANFPCPPSLMIGSDGDLSPAYSLTSFRTNQVPHPSHPVWTWQLGTSVIPPHFNQRFRKTTT
ncbi:SKI/DACH domain-containing protein 1 [Neoarius graeffei]|uniref:SKI/DACH domain-containing protein 1 n=1 Tax=Neoarius graeffei TaxID=443677 RepID=UPI00298D4B66|nr:SKI/DACH domain-containing protein 1 [Neoarius graeffei]